MHTFADIIVARLAALDMKQTGLHAGLEAAGVSVSRQAVNHWCTGAALPDEAIRPTVADLLGLPLADVLAACSATAVRRRDIAEAAAHAGK